MCREYVFQNRRLILCDRCEREFQRVRPEVLGVWYSGRLLPPWRGSAVDSRVIADDGFCVECGYRLAFLRFCRAVQLDRLEEYGDLPDLPWFDQDGNEVDDPLSNSVISSRAPEPVGAYPHAKRVGNLLFLSGLGPRKRGSKVIPGVTMGADGRVAGHDIAQQCAAVFENVRLVLEEAGARWENIVDVTVFLTDMKGDFPIFNRLYAEAFAGPGKPNPTRTTVEVTALPTPIAIELKIVATI